MDKNGTVSNFNVENDIIFNKSNGSFLSVANSNSFDGLNANNNVLYHNGNNNPAFSGNRVQLILESPVKNGDIMSYSKPTNNQLQTSSGGVEIAKISNTLGSGYQSPYAPVNSSDGVLATNWSAVGDNQWLLFTLVQPFRKSYLEIAFLTDQKYSSYFDILAQQDNLTWKPIFTHAASCNFSGDFQVFDFPSLNSNIEYSFLKFVGHGNSSDNENSISKIWIFGTPSADPGTGSGQKPNLVQYPDPTTNIINISIDEATLPPYRILILNYSGKIVPEKILNAENRRLQIPLALNRGNYTAELITGNSVMCEQKIIVIDK